MRRAKKLLITCILQLHSPDVSTCTYSINMLSVHKFGEKQVMKMSIFNLTFSSCGIYNLSNAMWHWPQPRPITNSSCSQPIITPQHICVINQPKTTHTVTSATSSPAKYLHVCREICRLKVVRQRLWQQYNKFSWANSANMQT